MFKCCECGAEYEQKPDFCDCGNDIFEEITPAPQKPQEYDRDLTQKHKKTFKEQYPGLSAFVDTLDPISVGIFCLCIFLSILSIIFIKPKEQPVADVQKEKPTIERKVADINSFWNDTPPKAQPKTVQTKEEPTIASQITDMISKMSEPVPVKKTAPAVQKPVQQRNQTVQKTTVQQKTQQKKTQSAQKQTQTAKPTPKTTKKPATTQPKPISQPVKTTQSTQQVKTTQPQQTQTPQQTVTRPVQTQPVVNTAAIQAQAAQELKTFKNGLRNTLFRKINFTKVYGDGSCIVDFRVDSTGRLVNKSFSKQSTNNTLNDEVYQAIMSTPTYKAPPSSYRGQTLHFSVKFQSGQYEVSLY